MFKRQIILLMVMLAAALPAPYAFAQDASVQAPLEEAEKPVLDIQEIKSDDGIRAWLVEDHSLPIIAVSFSFLGAGSAQDPADKQGLARLLSNTMDEGAGDLTSQEFQAKLRDNSISLSFRTDRDDFGGALKTLSHRKKLAFDLLKTALIEPRFDDEPVARMVAANEARIRSSLGDPEWIAARILNDAAYGDHPYALNSGGTLSGLSAIQPDDLRAYHARALARENLVVSITGDINADEAEEMLDLVFGDLPKRADLEIIPDAEIQNPGIITVYEQDIPQSIITGVQPAIGRNHPDYHTANVMNFVLGSSGFGSRLTQVIREERGLTYGIYSYFDLKRRFNGLALSTSTKNETAGEMIDLIRQEWKKMAETEITDQELADAKSYLIGSLPLSLTSTDNIAGLMTSLQSDGLPKTYLDERNAAIEAVQIEDVQSLASRMLDMDKMSIVIVGKPENIDMDRIQKEIPNAR
jgi:zinc protease